MSAWPTLPPLRHLQYQDPQELWDWIARARESLGDPNFWKFVYDDLMRNGASGAYADAWVAGLRKLAAGEYPAVKKKP